MKRVCLLLLGLAYVCIPGQARAGSFTPAVEYSSSETLSSGAQYTIGYEFTTSVTLDVNALAYFNDGKGDNHEVGLWTSTGTLLASTTVLSTDPVQGHFQYDSIPVLVLAPGTYRIGGQYLGNGDPVPYLATGITTIPGYTYVTDEQTEASGLNFPTNSTDGFYGQNGILAVDFSAVASVPEPGSLVLLSTGALAVVAYSGSRRRKEAQVHLQTALRPRGERLRR